METTSIVPVVAVATSICTTLGIVAWHAGRVRGRLDSHEQRLDALETLYRAINAIREQLARNSERLDWIAEKLKGGDK